MPPKNMSPPPPPPSSTELAAKVRAALEVSKGETPVVLDVRALSTLTDYMILVSGQSAPHLKAMANEIIHTLKAEGISCYRKSGLPDDGWIVLDYVDVVIHIFRSDLRAYYALEELWANAAPMA